MNIALEILLRWLVEEEGGGFWGGINMINDVGPQAFEMLKSFNFKNDMHYHAKRTVVTCTNPANLNVQIFIQLTYLTITIIFYIPCIGFAFK